MSPVKDEERVVAVAEVEEAGLEAEAAEEDEEVHPTAEGEGVLHTREAGGVHPTLGDERALLRREGGRVHPLMPEGGAHLGTGKEAVPELEEIQASRENLDRDQDHNRSFLHPVIMFMFSLSPARCTAPCKLYCTAFMYFHLVNNSSPSTSLQYCNRLFSSTF